MGSTTTSSASRAAVVAAALLLVACARPYVSPLAPPPHRDEITAGYDAAWAAIVRALAKENVALRAIARDSGVDRKSTRLNSSHTVISYAVFCLKKKKNKNDIHRIKHNIR